MHDILWNVQVCGWMEHAVWISRGLVDHYCTLPRMSFVPWCLLSKLSIGSVFVVQSSQVQHRQRYMYVVPTQRGKNELISAFWKSWLRLNVGTMIWKLWGHRQCSSDVYNKLNISLMCKKIPFSDQVNQIWGTNEGKHKYVLYNVNVWRETRWVVLNSEFENTIFNRHS